MANPSNVTVFPKLRNMSGSIRAQLAAMLGFSHGGDRDMYQVLGYPRVLIAENLMAMYLRNPIANRIVHSYPRATWREPPIIRDETGESPIPGDPAYSPFVEAWDTVSTKFRVLHHIERADRLSGIGRFGLLVMGFRDGKKTDQPLESDNAPLLYLQAYAETNVTINEWDWDIKSPRFGKPIVYTVQTGNLSGEKSSQRRSIRVHYTRAIHLAEFLDEDDNYGTPRLFPLYNHLQDLEKVVGSSAETFWLNARPGLGLFADADAQISEEQLADMKTQATDFEHQLRRILAMQGVTAQQFQALVADPKPNIETLLDLIAGGSGIPKRILIGSERGELSSSQDENNWAARIDERRKNFGTPCVLQPLITRLIATNNLPKPEGDWWVEWPEAAALGPEAEANVAFTKSNTLKNYMSTPGAELIVPPGEFRQTFLGLEPSPEDVLTIEDEALFDEVPASEPEGAGDDVPPVDEEETDDPVPAPKKNAKSRTLYVRRDVVNKKDIYEWAKLCGFKGIEKDLHVTLVYSRTPVDWFKMPEAYGLGGGEVKIEGGPRQLEVFGRNGKKCVVLLISSETLKWRHDQFRKAGCSSDFGGYQPHVTITYKNAEDYDLSTMEAYQGDIILGEEVWEETKQVVEHPTINRKATRSTQTGAGARPVKRTAAVSKKSKPKSKKAAAKKAPSKKR